MRVSSWLQLYNLIPLSSLIKAPAMRTMRYYLPAIIWILLVLYLCTLPGKDIPRISFFDKLPIDKLVHFAMFGCTVLLLCIGYYRQKKHISRLTLFLITLFAAFYGLAIEFIQKYFTVSRSFDMNDVAADTLGAIAGVWAFKLIRRWWLREKVNGK